jgi:hypothetical protein
MTATATTPMAKADLLEVLGLKKRVREAVALSEEQMTSGLKEALARGVEHAVTNLGRPDGFLADSVVRIPLPSKLQWTERALHVVGQDQLISDFIGSMNHAAEEAVPAAASVLGDSIRQMTLVDARAILQSTNTAATDYFSRTSRSNLHVRLLPIVKSATDKVGVTASYKRMIDQAGLKSLGGLGSFGRSLAGIDNLNLDDYVTDKALDGLFVKIAEQEKQIRENPAARTTEILQKVFGQGRK